MKKQKMVLVLLMALVINNYGWSAMPIMKESLPYAMNNSHELKTDSASINQIKMLSALTAAKYGELKGKKLNALQRLAFNLSKQRMKSLLKHLSAEPNILSKISWLLKGVLLGPIALAIGYLIFKDEDRELIKWIWFGCIGFAIIAAIILLA